MPLPGFTDCIFGVEYVLIQNHEQGDEFRQLLNAVNRDGQEVHILTKGPIPRDHKSNDKKSNFEERVTFFAKILVALPAGVNLPLSCDIFAEVYPGLVGAEEIGSAEELSDLVASNGET